MQIFFVIQNNKLVEMTGLILMDVGAEYKNYSSDMTRTIPVSGHIKDKDIV